MKKLLSFLYDFFFIDQDKKQLSHTKFWSQIGYGCMCFTFVWAVVNGSDVDYMIWLLFGVVVIGNRSLLKILNKQNNHD